MEGSAVGSEEQDRIDAVRKMRRGKNPMTFKEIAAELGCTPAEAAQMARRARGEAGPTPEPEATATGKQYPALVVLAPLAKGLGVVTGIGAIIAAVLATNVPDFQIGPGLPSLGVVAAIAALILGGSQAVALYAIGEAAMLLVELHGGVRELLTHDRKE